MAVNKSLQANIALTYANDQCTDGAGAQLQRVYGIYAISRFLRVPYVHSPLKRIDYQGLAALESNSSSEELESRYNRIFEIPSDIEMPEERVVCDLRDPHEDSLRQLRIDAETTGKLVLARIVFPYGITDRHPEIYRYVLDLSPFERRRSEVFRLAIHVRRGEQMALASDRMLPNSYYIYCALRFADVLQRLDIPFVCELYTEVPTKPFVVTPQHHGINSRIPGDVTVDPKVNRIEDFDIIPKLAKFINGDPIEALERMATADALVMSRSSYTYVAAILNDGGIVLYHPFWHSRLKDWVTTDANGVFSEADVMTRLERWKRERAKFNTA